MVVTYPRDIGASTVDGSVDVPLHIGARPVDDLLTVQAEFEEIAFLHEFRRPSPGEQKAIRLAGTARAHMTERVQDLFTSKDSVRGYKVGTNRCECVQRLLFLKECVSLPTCFRGHVRVALRFAQLFAQHLFPTDGTATGKLVGADRDTGG